MIRAIDKALSELESKGDEAMDPKEIFDGFDPAKYEDEAKERWGHTDAWKESKRRVKAYSKEDWARLQEEQAEIYGAAFAALTAGKKADDADVMEIAERHRQSIDRWFYPCPPSMHAGLADLYENDERFAANIDKFGSGLTPFLSAAIRANAKRTR